MFSHESKVRMMLVLLLVLLLSLLLSLLLVLLVLLLMLLLLLVLTCMFSRESKPRSRLKAVSLGDTAMFPRALGRDKVRMGSPLSCQLFSPCSVLGGDSC